MFLVAGENLIDLVESPDSAGLPQYVANPGGSPMNVAMAMARQGVETGYLTPVSQDRLGGLIATRLDADRVQMLAQRRPEPTSLAVVSLDDGIPSYAFHREGTAERQVTLGALEAMIPRGAIGFHVGSLALASGPDAQAYATLFGQCRARGLFAALDPNVRPGLIPDRDAYVARIIEAAGVADMIKLSDEDLAWLCPGQDLEGGIAWLRAVSGAALLVVTRGPEGAIALAGDIRVEVAAPKVAPMVDTVGAGDTFHGTLLASLTQAGALSSAAIAAMDQPGIEALIARAAKAAAINCTRAGCQPPSRAELDASLGGA